ncbi:phage tail tube protein [Rhizobium azibense]|uniref:Lambda phage tail tube protein N-terminal domain-containing protein n=1 Tax=Rhizobium azibense TaxID=1136135 RepID=A0A4R3RI95_9HYPH|nr:phage tail tube protein [Rhizobium azibense]TCU34167.1 hypothetical protein EV129_113152 [Rhizobium azibense]
MPVKSTAKAGIGVILQRGNGASPEVFATIANVSQISAGGVTVNMIDATHLDSPDFYAEFIPGLKTADEWTATIGWDPSDPTQNGTTGLRKQMEDRTSATFRMNTAAIGLSESLYAECFVSQLGNIEITPDGLMTQSLTLRPTGAPYMVANA